MFQKEVVNPRSHSGACLSSYGIYIEKKAYKYVASLTVFLCIVFSFCCLGFFPPALLQPFLESTFTSVSGTISF